MAVRSVSVFLRANVTGFVSGMRAAGGAVGNLNRQIQRTPGAVGGAFGSAGRAVNRFERTVSGSTGRQRQAFDRLGRTGTVMAVGLVGGFALATRESMKFDKQMSAVKSVAGATSGQLNQLRQAALDAGRSTAYSATQAAQAEEELAKAGVSAADVIGGGLKGALNLAAAGTLQVGEAAEIAATAMTQFQLSGKDVPHIADLLSAGANKAQGSVHDLGFALKMGGLVGHQFGLSVEETTGTLAAFASAGLVGRDSGTSFKTMLLHLANPTKKTSDMMKDLGINVYDAQGKFIGITALAEVLRTKLAGLTEAQRNQALAQIFGTDAIRGANVLYRQGAAGLQGWINKVNDSGNAARTAGTKLNNLSGDLNKLKGAFTTALIGAGDGAQGPLRGLVQSITGTINAFNALPGPAKSAMFWVAGISGAALLGAKGLIFMVTTAKDARIALEALGLTGTRVTGALTRIRTGLAATAGFMAGPWGIAIAAGIGALAIWEGTKRKAAQATQEFTAAIEADSGALGTNTRAAVANKLEQEGVLAAAQKLGLNMGQVTDAVLGNGQAYEQITRQLDGYLNAALTKGAVDKNGVRLTQEQVRAAQDLRNKLESQNGSVRASVAAAQRQAAANHGAAASQQQAGAAATQHTGAEDKLASAMNDATRSADDLQKALDELSKANMDADQAAINQRKSALDAAKASDRRRGASDKEKQALLDLAEIDKKQLVAMKGAGVAGDILTAKQRELARQFVKIATAMTGSRAAAIALAKRYGLLSSASDLTKVTMGEYIGRVTKAAEATRAHASKTGSATAAQQKYAGQIRSSLPVLYALAGSNKAARAQVDALARSAGVVAGRMNTSKAAFLRVAESMHISRGRAESLWQALNKLKSKQVKVDVDAKGHWDIYGSGIDKSVLHDIGRFHGGPIPKTHPGATRARDSVPAMLRVDEHVWTPEEVDAAGGHSAMYRMRSAAKAGKLKGYAAGGRVSLGSDSRATPDVVNDVVQPINIGVAGLVASIAATMAAALKKALGEGGPVVQAARSQIGLPYSWGGGGLGGPSYGIGRGAGTMGFDCSGLTEYAWGKGRGIDIGGVTDSQWANSKPIGGPRPGALAFPSGPSVHVMLGSSKPGYVIQAPHTGAFVEEVPRSGGSWRWPTRGYAAGGAVRRLGAAASGYHADGATAELANLLGVAGSGPRGAERHTAQIAASGGPARVWAEPETGGEAYIPLASSKRTRSKSILSSVARRFGMQVTGMADGGVIGMADGGVDDGEDLNLSDLLSRWEDAVNPATSSDVSEAKAGRKTQADQVAAAKRALAKAKRTRLDKIHDARKRLKRAYASHGKGRANRVEDAKEALKKAKRTDTVRNAEARLRKERTDLTNATKKLTDTEKRYQYSRMSPTAKLGAALDLGIRNTGAFIANLQTLADRGFGDLARNLLATGGPEAEKMAADAVKLSNSKLSGLQGKMNKAQQQQDTLAALPNILTVRASMKSLGGKGGSWVSLLTSTGLGAGDLAAAVHLMAGDLAKTPTGRALLADMKAHGYAAGGRVTGPAGMDRVPAMLTEGEYVINRRSAGRHAGLIQAINEDRGGDVFLRHYARGGWAGKPRGSDGASATAPQVNQTFVHPEMNAAQLAREAAREAAWMLR